MFFHKMLKNQDIFGHPVKLNFNRQGEEYATPFGGIVTILLKLFLAFYLYTRINLVVNKGNNSYGQLS